MLDQITPIILTFNEDVNIERCLSRLDWARRIVIVDSFSADATLDLARAVDRVDVFQRTFTTHAEQWNFGLEKADTEWVLSLDADYVLESGFEAEVESLNGDPEGYFATLVYCIKGKPLRSAILPPRLVLFRRSAGHYVDDGHTQLLVLNGTSGRLRTPIRHDDRKPLSRWLQAQGRYTALEAGKLIAADPATLGVVDRIRKARILAPFLVFFYCLIVRGGVFDGWAGWYYAFQRSVAEMLLSIQLIEEERL